MAYFNRPQLPEEHQPAFRPQQQDDWDAGEETWQELPPEEDTDYECYDDDDDLDEMTEEEKRNARQGRMRVAAGLGDFFGVIAGTVVILVLIALLVSLVNWLQADISQTFTLWQTKL